MAAKENVMGRSHEIPILDTQMYEVHFAGGKVRELTTNIMTKSMYAQCNSEENDHLLLDKRR